MSRRIQGIPTAQVRGDEESRAPATHVTGEPRSAHLLREESRRGRAPGPNKIQKHPTVVFPRGREKNVPQEDGV